MKNYKYIPPADWHFLTPYYDWLCAAFGLGKKFKQRILDLVELRDDEPVLDVGCGTGIFLLAAREKYPGIQITGLDPDESALEIARKRLEKAGIKDVPLLRGYVESLPFLPQSAAVCFSTLVFHHLPNEIKKRALAEIHRVLKPGGRLTLTDFGQTKNRLLPRLLWFEKQEYLAGNLTGLLPLYMEEAGFRNIHIVMKKWPLIRTIIAEKK
jgi:ubiquinone/menaquinone biosynthesis C-methylase UbiE